MIEVSKTLKKPMSTSSTTGNPIANGLSLLLESGPAFHRLHLKVKGTGAYAAHIALNDLYNNLPDLTDTVIEGFQGASESLLDLSSASCIQLNTVEEGLTHIRNLVAMVINIQSMIPYSEVNNDLDSIKAELNKAKYKLIFLY